MSSHAIRTFHPMATVSGEVHAQKDDTARRRNYRGDMSVRDNKDANIPADENCKVYINRLPYNLTYEQLLTAIRNCGKVKTTHINNGNARAQEPVAGEARPHLTSDASVTFFDRRSAEALVSQNGRFRAGDATAIMPQVRWNRQKVAAENDTGKSRVLRFTGPSTFVNEESLHAYFRSKVTYNVEKVETIFSGTGITQMDWCFSGWWPQAVACKRALETEYPDIQGNDEGVSIEVRDDPCAGP